jgi:hypothetical protein
VYLQKARAGWDFLERAIARYGNDGAYQKLTHYGDEVHAQRRNRVGGVRIVPGDRRGPISSTASQLVRTV